MGADQISHAERVWWCSWQHCLRVRRENPPHVCNVFLDAKDANALQQSQVHIAATCKVLQRGFATVGIIALIDEATGYQEVRDRDALRQILEAYLRQELAAWVKRFPDEFYKEIYRLRNWPWPGMGKNRYSAVAGYTKDLIYERLAPGVLEEMEKRNPKDEKGHRKGKHHQLLSEDLGNPEAAGALCCGPRSVESA